MKRLGLVAMLLLASALSAHADSDVYNNITRHPRGDEALQLDTSACSLMLGAPQNGIPTSKAYRTACWLAAGASAMRCANVRRRRTCIPIRTTRA
jgi:hypothetical protein